MDEEVFDEDKLHARIAQLEHDVRDRDVMIEAMRNCENCNQHFCTYEDCMIETGREICIDADREYWEPVDK